MSDIVVGVDGSEGSVAALRWAVRDAEVRGAGVRAVLAWAPGGRPPEVDEVARSPYLDDLAFAASQILHRVVDSVEVEAGGTLVKVVERIVHSMPSHALLDESLDAQMLVVGSRHLPLAGRVVIGSVGEVCAHQACVPVVVIRGCVGGEDDRRPVVVGVDGSVPSLSALRWAAVEAALRKAPLHVVHVRMTAPAAPGTGSSAPGTVAAHEKRAAKEVLEYCLAECRAETECLDVQPRVVEGRTATSLIGAAVGAQLLVVGERGLGGFAGLLLGSTTHHCLTRARCPVAVVRGPRGDQI